jgi:uncharacterized protein (DUF2249 family)
MGPHGATFKVNRHSSYLFKRDPMATAKTIDVRTIVPRDRHPLIFGTFHDLAPGESLLVVNDHDPKPLHHQFEARVPGRFEWEYLESGPEVWKVRIGKTA